MKCRNIEKKIDNKELDYIIYFEKSRVYNDLEDKLFKNSEIIYKNETGGILKYKN